MTDTREEFEPVSEYTEGICGDGAAILADGVMLPVEDVVSRLNSQHSRIDTLQARVAELETVYLAAREFCDFRFINEYLNETGSTAEFVRRETNLRKAVDATAVTEEP